MKRVIAFLLAVVMTLSMMPVAALNILAAEDPNNDRALLGYAAKAIAGQPVVEDLNNNSFYPGQYGITAEEFCSVGTIKIDWDPEAFAKLNVTDGDMDDWAVAGYNPIMVDASNMVSWLGDVPDEWSTLAFFVADSKNIYFGFYITDPDFAYGNEGYYNGDAIQLCLDFGNVIGDQLEEDPDSVYNPKNIFYSFSCNGDGAPLQIMRQESGSDGLLTEADGVAGSASRTESGWCAEFSMSWDRLYKDYAWKAWGEDVQILHMGGDENLPLEIGCCLYYLDRSEPNGLVNWAAGTTNGITYRDGTPAVSWTAYDNGIHLELDYEEGMEFNCGGIVIDGVERPMGTLNNAADFNTIVVSNVIGGDPSYKETYTTASGWITENSAIQCGGASVSNPQFPVIGPDNTYKAVCLNGKVTAPGKLTSPVLTGIISELNMSYTKMFTDTQLSVTITITDLSTGAVYTRNVFKEADKNDKYTVWNYKWVLETPIVGPFIIEVVNNCPSAVEANKDRMTILSLTWSAVPSESPEEPETPSDCTDSFLSNVDVNEVGTELDATDLRDFFVIECPLNNSEIVHDNGDKKYKMGGISDMFANMNSRYFFRFKDISFNQCTWMFARGYKVVNSDELIEKFNPSEGIYKINNYYETDANGHMGGAGIYAQLLGGMLNIVLKYYDPSIVTRVGNVIYSIPCEGSEIMIADDGKLVSIIVDGKTYATVELSGSVAYTDMTEVFPRNDFAETAVLRLANGETYTLQNTLIACSYESQVGIVVRPGDIHFSAVQVGGYSDVAVPDLGQTAVTPWPDMPEPDTEPDTEPDIEPDPNEPEPDPDIPAIPAIGNYNVPMDQWVITGHKPGIAYADEANLGPMVQAAGLDRAALLHQGSIGLGEIDLSLYSKVIVTYTTDASEYTQSHYENNPQNRFLLLNADSSMVYSPAQSKIVAETTYSLPWSSWQLTTMEIDLTNVDYNGPVYLSWDTLPGTFMLVSSIEFVADDPAPDSPVRPGPYVPANPSNNTNGFISNVDANGVGVSLYDTDLSNFFTVELPLEGSTVVLSEGAKKYELSMISDMYADVNGKYFIRFKDSSFMSQGWMFVRGYKVVVSDEAYDHYADYHGNNGIYPIRNYYETDSSGHMGGAGIYAQLRDGMLHIILKYYAPSVVTRVGNAYYSIPCEGDDLMIADNGNLVSIIVDGKTYATVELTGSVVYTDINDVSPRNGFAKTAVLRLANGETHTLQNTLIACSCESQVGIAVRAGTIRFSAVQVGGYSDVAVPGLGQTAVTPWPDVPDPDDPELDPDIPAIGNYNVPMDQWVITGHKPGIAYADDVNLGPMVQAAGLDRAALLHQGSIGLGEIDLSLYSKVIVTYTTDASECTQSNYENNPQNRFLLLNADSSMVFSPAQSKIVAETTYSLPWSGWQLTTMEIDLTNVDYNGPVYFSCDTLPGLFMLISSIEFVADDTASDDLVSPEEAGVIAGSVDSFFVNGSLYFPQDGGAGDKLDAIDNTIKFTTDMVHDSMMLRGWIGFTQPIASFGYVLDGEIVFGDFEQPTEDGVKWAGGEHALRYAITVPLSHLSDGSHTVAFVILLEDGTLVLLRNPLTVVIGETPDEPDEPDEPDANEIHVTTTDTYGYFDLFSFTAPVSGTYTFNLPAGLGLLSQEAYDDWYTPEVDFCENADGATYSVDLVAGETWSFYVGAMIKQDWIITWTVEEDGPGYVDPDPDASYPLWSDHYNVVVHLSFDELYMGMEYPNYDESKNIFTPGQAASWNGVAYVPDLSVTTLTSLGWVAVRGEVGRFGYQIDNSPFVFDDSFTRATEQIVIDVSQSVGGDTGSRFKIVIDVAGLVGRHTVRTVYQNPAGEIVVLREFTLVMGEGEPEPERVLQLGANEIPVTEWIYEQGGVDYTFVVTTEGRYHFMGDFLCRVYDSMGILVGTGSVYLTPGTYTVSLGTMFLTNVGTYPLIVEFEMEEPDPDIFYPSWSDRHDVVFHNSFDQLYTGSGNPDMGPENIFTPGQGNDWNGIANIPDLSVTALTAWGWVAVMGEVGQFGYQIDNSAFVFDPAFTHETEYPVIDASQSAGADTGSRYKIVMDISGLAGLHTVRLVYRNTTGQIVVLKEFVLMMGASEPGEGMWTTHQGINNYPSEDDDPDTVYPPESGYEYTSDGFTVIQPDWTNCIPFVTVSTKEAQSIKNGIYLKFRVDDYSYDGGYQADQWISLSLNTGYENTGMLQPGSVEYGGGWLTLLRGHGDGLTTSIPHLTDPMTEDFGGSFTWVGSSSIPVEVDDQGREIYTLEITWNGYKYEIRINGVMQSNAAQITALLERLSPSGEFFVGVTMHTAVRGGSAGLTILEYGTSEATAVKPLGIDRKEPGENEIVPPPVIDPDEPDFIDPDPYGSYPLWSENQDVIVRFEFDYLFKGVEVPNDYYSDRNFFQPGRVSEWNGIAQLAPGETNTLTAMGWVAIMGRVGRFGYQIDNSPFVFDNSFTVTPEEGVIDASQYLGADTGSRYKISMDISGLEGWHTVRLAYQNTDGEVVILSEFMLNIGEADGSYEHPYIIDELPFSCTITGSHDVYYLFIPEEDCVVRITHPVGCYVSFVDIDEWEREGNDYIVPLRAGNRYIFNFWGVTENGGIYTIDYDEDMPHIHEYELRVTPPTCTDIGFTTYTCSCGDVYRDDIVPPLGHQPGEWMVDREATCTESGIRHSECSRCGTVLENVYIPATGHSYVTYMIREATCTEPGIMEHTCEYCGDTYPTYVYSEHRYVLSVHVDATCEADGMNTYTCDRCGDSYDEIIPGAHSYTAEITKIATEEEEGIITYTCSICGHSYTDIIPVRSSASVLLIQDRMPWDHNDNVLLLNHLKDAGYILGWDMVTTSTFRAADLAGYSVVMIANDQTTGTYDRLAALHDALTSYVRAGGVVIYGACDSGWAGGDIRSPLPGGVVKENFYSRYNYIADRLHPIVTGAMTDQKALTDALLYGNYCSHTYFHSDTLPADANIILRDAYGNPTLVEYTIGDGHVIASGLTWEFYYNRNAYEGGSLTYSKSVFDDLVVYAIGLSDPCEHIFDMGTVYGPTCTEDGYTLHTCLNCGLQMKDTFLPALGHTLGEWTVAYPATTEVNGLKQRCCTLCGAVLAEEIIPMLDAPIIQVQAPTDTVILGQEITFSVVIENCRPVKSLAVVPIFDTSVFELVDLRWTISALMQNIEPDTLRAVSVWSGSTDINTTVFTITLKAIATADSTAMDFTVILHDENGTVPAAVVAKNVSVIECPHEHMTCTEVDGDYHIGVCDLCGHSRVMSHRYESVCHTTCVDCGHERVAPHAPSPEWNGNGDMHWHDCELCGVHLGAAPHAYDDAYDAACNECGHSRFVNGDMDHDADVDSDDAVYLLYAILFGTAAYPVEQPLDLNRDGEANEDDALYLLYHSFFGESEYPLQSA